MSYIGIIFKREIVTLILVTYLIYEKLQDSCITERGREGDRDREIGRELGGEATNDTPYKWWSCDSGYKLLCTLCRNHPADLPFFGQAGHADALDGW